MTAPPATTADGSHNPVTAQPFKKTSPVQPRANADQESAANGNEQVPVERVEKSKGIPAEVVLEDRLASDELNWSQLAYELDLDSLARQVALNTIVKSYQKDQLTLACLVEMEVILKADIQQQIKKAIEDKLAVSLKLEFTSLPVLEVETPQQAFNRKQEQDRQAAIQQISRDPLVLQLNTLFAGELIESSVKKADSE